MRRGWPLWFGLFAMFIATVGVIVALVAFGGGGKQRGLVVRDEAGQPVSVRFDDGQKLTLENRQERTIAARRSDYPQTMRVASAAGAPLWEQRLQFEDLSSNSFRLIVGPTGLLPTPPQTGG